MTTSRWTSPSAIGKSIPRRGIAMRYPSGIGPIVGAGVGERVVESFEGVAAGVDAVADALGRAIGATEPARVEAPPVTRANPPGSGRLAGRAASERPEC